MTKTCSPHIKKISKKADTQPQPPDSEGKSRLTIDLSATLNRKFSILVAKTGKSKAEFVREWLEQLLQDIDV
jgi:hypothetical protein